MLKMKLKGLVVGSMLVATGLVRAEGFYVVGSVGQSDFKDISREQMEDNFFIWSGSYSDDSTDSGYKIQLGYRINENFSLEGGYVDLGTATMIGMSDLPDLLMTDHAKVDFDAKGFNIAGLLTLPVGNKASLFLKVGLINADTKISFSGVSVYGSQVSQFRYGTEDTSIKGNVGFGASWTFLQHIGVRAECERFSKVGPVANQSDVDLYSIGAYYLF